MSFRDLFSSVAGGYATFRPRYPEALYAFLADQVERRERAWDCGTGSGQAAADLARWFDTVVATDASAEQLSRAAPHPRVTYRVAPAEASGLPEASVDLVAVAQALHWFDLDRFWDEARRVLRPRGVLAVWSYGLGGLDDPALSHTLRAFARDALGPYWPPERALVDEGYRSLAFPFEELAVPALDMAADWTLDQLRGYVATWSAVGRFREARGRDPVPDLVAALAERWEEPARARRVSWPLALRAGRSPAPARSR